MTTRRASKCGMKRQRIHPHSLPSGRFLNPRLQTRVVNWGRCPGVSALCGMLVTVYTSVKETYCPWACIQRQNCQLFTVRKKTSAVCSAGVRMRHPTALDPGTYRLDCLFGSQVAFWYFAICLSL